MFGLKYYDGMCCEFEEMVFENILWISPGVLVSATSEEEDFIEILRFLWRASSKKIWDDAHKLDWKMKIAIWFEWFLWVKKGLNVL